MKILVAEDEPAMQKIIKMYLLKAGYIVDIAGNGREALDKLEADSYDLLIADWMMPEMNGIQLCREVRSGDIPVKIIMLTAKGEVDSEITGLSGGADDYIRKPFDPNILLLRIQKLLQNQDILECGRLKMNQKAHTVTMDNSEIPLTNKEYALLQTLLKNLRITLTRDTLIQQVWGYDYDGDERTLDTHIRRLRSKIGKKYITTHVGVGYRMEPADE